jgi:poly-gamma-glutamate synthesis protein (capsule biosynthesis protein)
LGHHAHILKGVEVYKNKVIFHSLGNFAFDTSAAFNMNDAGSIQLRKRYPWDVDPEYVGYGHPVDSRKTLITKVQIGKSGIERVSYLPAYINKYAQPEVLKADDPRFEQVVSYVEKVTRSQELPANFAIEADEVMVT